MPTPNQIISAVSSLMNDTAQTRYTNAACLPYLNLALDVLQEIFELNGIPITNETSTVLTVLEGVHSIGISTTPALPADMIEIQELWTSPVGLNHWNRVDKREFLPHYLEDGQLISQFLIWAWVKGFIELIPANADNDLKLDYTCNMFNTPILISQINTNFPYTNIKSYLEFETASLCAMFISENETRAGALQGLATDSIGRALGIPIKGMQSIVTRRRPFRASYRKRGINF